MSGKPKQCLHCQHLNWYDCIAGSYPTVCWRCDKPLNTAPVDDGYESVRINGRMVRRKKA